MHLGSYRYLFQVRCCRALVILERHYLTNNSRTTTWSVSIAGFPGLNIGEVASAALSAGFSYSWAQTKATGSTASITCPKGVTCGIVATAWVIKTTGQVRYSYSGNEGCPQTTEWADFEVTAPYIDVPDASPGMQAKMVFSGCVDTCGNVCTDSMKKGLPMCADLTGQIKNDLQPTPADGISLGPS